MQRSHCPIVNYLLVKLALFDQNGSEWVKWTLIDQNGSNRSYRSKRSKRLIRFSAYSILIAALGTEGFSVLFKKRTHTFRKMSKILDKFRLFRGTNGKKCFLF